MDANRGAQLVFVVGGLRLTSVACGGGIQSSDVAGGRAFRWLGVLLTWAEAEASRALTWAVGGDGWGYC